MSFVNNKIGSALECTHRPLKEGEQPKHQGHNSVYEATKNLDPQFEQDLKDGKLTASWKIDGTCCMISDGTLYRRLDIRKGAVPPANAVLGEIENGVAKICWIPVNGTTNADSKWHISALGPNGFWSYNPVTGPYFVKWDDVADQATYELVGPNVQGNLYNIPEIMTSAELTVKKVVKEVQLVRHYLIRHGDFIFDFPVTSLLEAENKVEWFKNFILSHRVEGIVFRHQDQKTFYKVNRGHIGTPTKLTDRLELNPLL